MKVNVITQQESQIIKLFDIPKEVINDNERQRRVYSIGGVSPTVLGRTDQIKVLVNGDKNNSTDG